MRRSPTLLQHEFWSKGALLGRRHEQRQELECNFTRYRLQQELKRQARSDYLLGTLGIPLLGVTSANSVSVIGSWGKEARTEGSRATAGASDLAPGLLVAWMSESFGGVS